MKKLTNTKLFTFTFFILLTQLSLAQVQKPVKAYDMRFGGSARDTDVSSIRTNDGGFLLTASSLSGISGNKTTPNQGDDDWWVVKTDADGNIQWDFNFGGTSEEGFEAGAVQTADGNFVLAGRTRSGISGDIDSPSMGSDDILLIKISAADRSVIWQTRVGGNGADWAFDLKETSGGHIIVGGYTTSTDLVGISPMGSLDLYLVKINSVTGDKIWERTYGGSGFESADELLPNVDGGVVVGAYSASADLGQANNGSFDYWIFSTDGNGDVLWEDLYGGPGLDAVRSMAQMPDGGFVFAGQSGSGAGGDKSEGNKGFDDIWVVRTNSIGELLWEKTIGGAGYDWGQAAYALQDGSVIVGGFSNSPSGGDKLSDNINASLDIWFFNLDVAGNLIWQADFGGAGSDGELNIPFYDELNHEVYLSGGTQSGQGYYLSTPNFGGSNTDLWLSKFKLHSIEKTSLNVCDGQSANVLLEGTLHTGSNNRRYELRNPDGSLNGVSISGESPEVNLLSGTVVNDTTLTVYALSDVGDGSILEEFIGEVNIAVGDELLNGAKETEIVFEENICYNKRAKLFVTSSEIGVMYSLIDGEGNVLVAKEGSGGELVLRSPRLKESTFLSLKLDNMATGCSVIHDTPVTIEVEDKITAKMSFDRNDIQINEPVSFSVIDDDGIVSWEWTFNKKKEVSGRDVFHTFKRPGVHWIKLKVTNENGCTKEIRKKILIKRKIFFGVPGVFWPCTNQGPFKAKLKHTKKERLVIVNGRGKVVFSGKNEWHGFDKRRRLVPAGRYYYRIMATTVDGKPFQKRGSFYVSY
ncbi:PKD domain-containing protein [Roseivirga sp. E12]|uniref:PKD domain-containing protein n=1 Tax=Roseivirga sp. E12 TaxID=2819237 RepID=UPI001ABC28A6|nr:PKD domain-containing protein [Roseivirga sp. E12]MBO3698599.1 PKD domain-containing protein [Roseivirga sp. E12]